MIRLPHRLSGVFSRVCLTLAVLAIAVKVMLPAGFMVAPGSTANSLPFALVICTGEGAMTVAPGAALPDPDGRPSPADKTSHDNPCAFAGHGLGVAPPNLTDSAPVTFIAYRAPRSRPLIGLAPGRGLSAPPLPARGPPILLT